MVIELIVKNLDTGQCIDWNQPIYYANRSKNKKIKKIKLTILI